MVRLLEMSQRVGEYCRNIFRDSRLDNLDAVSSSFCRTPLHIAVMSGDIQFAKNILSLKPDLASKQDNRGWTPLHLASAKASLQMVKLLLKAWSTACIIQDNDGRTPLHLAAMNDRVEIMETLMEKRPDLIHLRNCQNGESILHFCVKSSSNIETLELLVDKFLFARDLDQKIIINSKDNNGKTVLQLAAETGKTEMIQYLLESSNINTEVNEVEDALKALSPADRENLETRFLEYFGNDKKHKNGAVPNNNDQNSQRDRVNALMVVATLVAGIAFQAAMNPPGGLWQEDSKVSSETDPVTFIYYLDRMFSTTSDYTKYFRSGYSQYTHIDSYPFAEALINTMRDYAAAYKDGLVFEDLVFHSVYGVWYDGVIRNLPNNSTDRDRSIYMFFPYIIRYAGQPIMAYTDPPSYKIYMATNGVAFAMSLLIMFLVICGFLKEKSIAQVRILVVLMCISIGCIAFGYLVALQSMVPFFDTEAHMMFYVLHVFFGVCCSLGALWLLIWTAWIIVKLRKKRKHHHTGVISYYLKGLLFSRDAKGTGKVILFVVGICAFRYSGYMYSYIRDIYN
ncbi:uncharacterized protein LOC113314152 isoform X1 [Papaver somniferum]|uniref:uncharacterized protein LOC113314152 isoform X1 n=1 Tax=Papaver somniferum TaxID=3469 RepID=UPI000E6F9761|nr:uncharacterized protein LOC113314152 isoform X1 [Papaver somniferum]